LKAKIKPKLKAKIKSKMKAKINHDWCLPQPEFVAHGRVSMVGVFYTLHRGHKTPSIVEVTCL